MTTLTVPMQRVVDKLRETGKPLVRWPSGFWSYEGCSPLGHYRCGLPLPAWHCPVDVLNALERMGVLRRKNRWPEPWRDHRELVQ